VVAVILDWVLEAPDNFAGYACMRIKCRAWTGAKGWESDPRSAKQHQRTDAIKAQCTSQPRTGRQRSIAYFAIAFSDTGGNEVA
jgi:hypothetical protein